jgi:ABC-type branched-subunit amino acid transport system substrate-binding protein
MRECIPAVVLSLLCGCAAPSLDGVTFSCEVDADCASDEICHTNDGARGKCGLSSTKPIVLGFSGPLDGPDAEVGHQVKRGIAACLAEVNDNGGLYGRRLELRAMNDDADLATARANGLALLDVEQEVAGKDNHDRVGKDGVFAMLGAVGPGAALELAPLFTKNAKVLFAPVTGLSTYLRDGTDSSYVFNVRAGYRDEALAMVEYLARYRVPRVADGAYSYRRVLAVTQDDVVGAEGYDAMVTAFDQNVAPLPSADAMPHFVHMSGDPESMEKIVGLIQAYLDDLVTTVTDSTVSAAVVIAVDYLAADALVRQVKDWTNQSIERSQRLDLQFLAYSSVDGDSLRTTLNQSPSSYTDVRDGETQHAYAEGVLLMQPVPDFGSSARGAAKYRAAISALDGKAPSTASFEGYIGAELLVEAMQRTGRQLSTPALLETLATDMADVDLQLGAHYGFSAVARDASASVWATILRERGGVEAPFVWRRGEGIVDGAW